VKPDPPSSSAGGYGLTQGVELICPGDNYVNEFEAKDIYAMETEGSALSRGNTGVFCTNPSRLMRDDWALLKIPPNTIKLPSNSREDRPNLRIWANQSYCGPGGTSPGTDAGGTFWFRRLNGKYSRLKLKGPDREFSRYHQSESLYLLIRLHKWDLSLRDQCLFADSSNPAFMDERSLYELWVGDLSNFGSLYQNLSKALFFAGKVRIWDWERASGHPNSGRWDQVYASCTLNSRNVDLRGEVGLPPSRRWTQVPECTRGELKLQSPPLARNRHDSGSGRSRFFCVVNEQNDGILASVPGYQWDKPVVAIGIENRDADTYWKYFGMENVCALSTRVTQGLRLDGSISHPVYGDPISSTDSVVFTDQRTQVTQRGLSTHQLSPGNYLIYAVALQHTGVPLTGQYHQISLLGKFSVSGSPTPGNSPPSQAPPPPASQPLPVPPPPSTPLPTPPPQSSTEPLVKETPLVSRALKPELGVRQPWLRPRYGNLESYRNQGTWTKDIGAGYERHDWDTPAFINLRKVDDKALFANHPKRLDYYPDGVIPVINFETDLTYRIDLAEIHKQIKERGYSETETTQIIGKLGPNYRGCSISAVHFLNGGRSTHLGTVPLAPQLKMSSLYLEGNYLFDNNPLTDKLISLNVNPQQGIEFVSRIECKIQGIKKGNTTENFLYISKERSFIWQSNPYVILLSSKNEGDENSLFTFDSSFLMETEKGKWGINGGLKTPPMNNPFKADLDKTSLCVDNKCGNVVKTYFSPDNEAIFSSINLRARLKRLLSPRERYSSFDKEINSVLNDEELAFSYGFFFTTEVNYGVGDVLAYPDGEKTESVPRAFGPVWAAPNSKRAKNYLRQLRPNIDPKILESRWLERQKYLRSNNFDNQSISRSLAYCNWEKNGERGFNARARYGFPADPKGILSDLANDLEGKCTWLDKPLPSEIVKTNPPPDVLPPPASACNQQLAPTCASNPRFSKIRFGAYYFRDAATSARVEPFNIYLRENSTYVIGEREDLPSVSGNYFICGDKIHFQNFSKIGTFTSQNQLQIESFLPGLAGIQKVFLCSGNACRTEGEVPVASKLCQPKFIQISPPPPVKPEPLPEQEKKPALQPITPPQVGEQPRKPIPEIITPIQIPPPPTSVPGDTGGFRQLPPGAISAPVPIPPPAIIPPPPSSVPRDTGFGQSRPVPISPPTIVPPPPVQPAPQPVAKPTPPQPVNKSVPVKKPEPIAAPQPKPTVPPAKKEPEFSVPIAR